MGAVVNLANKATYFDQPTATSHQINVTVAEGETIVFGVIKGTNTISVSASSGTATIRKSFSTNRLVAGDVVGATAGTVTLTFTIGATEVVSIIAVPVSNITYNAASTGVSNAQSLTDSVSSSLGKLVFSFSRAGGNAITITSPTNAVEVANLVTTTVDAYMGFKAADIGTTTSQTIGFSASAAQNLLMLLSYTVTDPYLDSFAVEADLGAGYVDITADINMQARIVAEGGIRSPQFIDLLASSGRMVFQLDNTSSNSGGVYGYYTPGHANARAGWDEGVPIRLKIVHNSITTYKWQGWVTRVEPTVGQFRRPVVNVTAEDWLGVAARTGLKQQALQLNKRADEVITDVVDDMDLQPISRSLATGQETFTQALDSDRDERDTVYSVFSKLTRSEIGRVFMTQDSTGGGVLRFEDRHYRLLTDSGDRLITFDNTMDDMQVEYRRESIYNEIRVKTFPRNIGLVPEILADLTNKPSIQPGSTLTLTLNYRDPNQQAQRISGKDMITPVSDSDNTDYIFGSVNDGVTDDLDSDITLNVTFGANSALVAMENTGTQAAFVNKLQLRGTAIRLFDPIIAEASDSDSVALRGRITLDFDMPYQQDPLEGESFANYLRDQLATPKKRVARLMFLANKDQDMLEAAVRGNVSSRFRIQEGQSAIAQDYFINAWKMTIGIGGRVDMEWIPADADEQGYWILGTSTLGETTYLGV